MNAIFDVKFLLAGTNFVRTSALHAPRTVFASEVSLVPLLVFCFELRAERMNTAGRQLCVVSCSRPGLKDVFALWQVLQL